MKIREEERRREIEQKKKLEKEEVCAVLEEIEVKSRYPHNTMSIKYNNGFFFFSGTKALRERAQRSRKEIFAENAHRQPKTYVSKGRREKERASTRCRANEAI